MEITIQEEVKTNKKWRGGRPSLDEKDKRKNRIVLRFTDEELKQFDDVPRGKLNQFLVDLILKRKRNIKNISPVTFETLKELNRIGTNLNQMSHRINEDFLQTGQQIKLTDEMKSLLEKYKTELERCLQK